jgi:hypothetical protein
MTTCKTCPLYNECSVTRESDECKEALQQHRTRLITEENKRAAMTPCTELNCFMCSLEEE